MGRSPRRAPAAAPALSACRTAGARGPAWLQLPSAYEGAGRGPSRRGAMTRAARPQVRHGPSVSVLPAWFLCLLWGFRCKITARRQTRPHVLVYGVTSGTRACSGRLGVLLLGGRLPP